MVIFIIRLLRGDLQLRLLLGIGIGGGRARHRRRAQLVPERAGGLRHHDVVSRIPRAVRASARVLQGIGVAMLLIVIVGAGEVLYRERLPQHLAIAAHLEAPRARRRKRVFLAFVLGYTLVAFFLGYQVAFYLIADKFGAWSPAEVPYDDMLNTALPWIAVLFAGFFPALQRRVHVARVLDSVLRASAALARRRDHRRRIHLGIRPRHVSESAVLHPRRRSRAAPAC